jgi:hypothetical protein
MTPLHVTVFTTELDEFSQQFIPGCIHSHMYISKTFAHFNHIPPPVDSDFGFFGKIHERRANFWPSPLIFSVVELSVARGGLL